MAIGQTACCIEEPVIAGDADTTTQCPEPINLAALGYGERIASYRAACDIRQNPTETTGMFLPGPLDVRFYTVKINACLPM